MEGNEEKTPHPSPLFVKGLKKTQPRKSVRSQPSIDLSGYDLGREDSNVEGETEEEDEETNAMLPSGN